MIGRLHHVVIDCPDPTALAGFYSKLLGQPITYNDGEWVVVAPNAQTSGLAFQQSLNYQAPDWPDPDRPQQVHLDVMVDDLNAAAEEVIALGAKRLAATDSDFQVYADPAGHPFCLVSKPDWAPPIHP